jgi:hypothetical protein
MSAYALAAALVLAFVATHVQLWRVRRRLGKESKSSVGPKETRSRRRVAMVVTWGFGAAALGGALAAQHGYYWVTPLVFGALAIGVSRIVKTRLSPQLEQKVAMERVLLGAAATDPPPPEAGREARIEWLRKEWPEIEANAAKNGVDPNELAALKREIFGTSGGWGFEGFDPPGQTRF